jgi:chemotaxis protein methyltransferase CheR
MYEMIFPEAARVLPKACAEIQSRTGVECRAAKKAALAAIIADRLGTLKIDAEQYLARLRDVEDNELQYLLDRLLTNVTGFFRNPEHFRILAAVMRETSHPLVLWSAACATGEEPYSMAVVMAETGRTDCQILASDLSNFALQRASRGVYDAGHLEGVSAERRERFFELAAERSIYRVRPALRKMVVFRHINLTLPLPFQQSQRPHVVFCRHVLMYMRSATRQRVVAEITHNMRVGGYLFLGSSESLIGIKHSLVEIERCVYRKQPGHRIQ